MAPECTHCPRFTALDFDGECVASDDNLSVVLETLRQDFDPDAGEELCIWENAAATAPINGSRSASGSLTLEGARLPRWGIRARLPFVPVLPS